MAKQSPIGRGPSRWMPSDSTVCEQDHMSYSRRLINWILEGKFLFIFLIIVFTAFFLNRIDIGCNTVDNIRFYGLLLELIGTYTLVSSLSDKLFTFKGYGLSRFFRDYFGSFPFRRIPKKYSMKAEAGAYSITMGDLRGVLRPKEDLKDIIRYFDGEIQYLHKKLAEAQQKLDVDLQSMRSKLEGVQIKLSKDIAETKGIMTDSAVSNIWLELFGLSCIILGLVMGTVPDIVQEIIL